MTLYQNAKISIELGVEDFKLGVAGDDKRFFSSIRNIYAGILLLFKYKLQLLSPSSDSDLLILENISIVRDSAKNTINFKGEGKKTINYHEIKKRFKSLGISVDWKPMGSIYVTRNNLEHYYSDHSKEQARKIISDTFSVLKDFIKSELKKEPGDILGHVTWEYIIAQKDIYQSERKLWEQTIKDSREKSRIKEALFNLTCPDCNLDLFVKTTIGLKCKVCGKELTAHEYIELAFQNAYALSVRDYKHGASDITCTCPNCNRHTYFIEDDLCYICGDSGLARCDCGNFKTPESDRCDDCSYKDYLMSKND